MSILIACSPSTGSSLLRRILNRHSQIFCGSETSLFAKEMLYLDWNKYKHRLLKKSYSGLVNAGWHHFIGVELGSDYMINKKILSNLVDQSDTFFDFINGIYDPIFKATDKKIWAEKTPSNAFVVDHFLNTFLNGKVIHISRNPYDTIASLVNRGMSIYNAVAVYLLNTSKIINSNNNENVIVVKYEDLVAHPEKTLRLLLERIDLEFESNILLEDEKVVGIDHMEGWAYKESESIGSSSVGRFKKLSNKQQELILNGMACMTLNVDEGCKTIQDICVALNYNYRPLRASNGFQYFKNEMQKDKIKRSLKKSYFNVFNYPIEIHG